MALTICDCSVMYILPFLDTSQISGQTDRLQKPFFSVAGHLCFISESEPDVYAMGLRLSGISTA